MADISADDVKKLAALSSLQVTPEETEKLKADLEIILEYIEQLGKVDVSGLEPTYQVTGLVNVTREDKLIDYGLDRDDLLKNAPDSQDGQIKVNRVIA